MKLSFWLNGVYRHDDVEPDTLLLDFLRDKGCYSVKRGCETANCGLCTVLMDGKPVLSCSTLALRAEGKKIVTMEGMQKEAEEIGGHLSRKTGRRAVRLLQSGIYHECFCNGKGT